MKITYMLKREDFYSINQRTLDSCFPGNGKRTHLYIYPELNAIVTAQPSKKVRDYLLCEYSVRASRIKRSLVKAYVRLCLVSRGILSSMSMYVHGDVGKGILIYPCNKKYRIFNFDSGTVEVVIKNGFPSRTIQHEVIFRNQPDLPDFVPMLISSTESRYQERIIDGCPLPRISAGFESYRGAAYKLLNEFAETCSEKTSGSKYSELLRMQINALITDKVRDKQKLTRITQALCGVVSQTDTIDVRFSHGDFQAGNIWVENRTNKIFIIDWESWGKRSGWYDKAALYDGLRCIDGYLSGKGDPHEKATVLLEDLIFQMTDLNDLPFDYGEAQFCDYIGKLERWCADAGLVNASAVLSHREHL